MGYIYGSLASGVLASEVAAKIIQSIIERELSINEACDVLEKIQRSLEENTKLQDVSDYLHD